MASTTWREILRRRNLSSMSEELSDVREKLYDTFTMAYVKHLVSKKKKRYKEDGFDLDLAYIKPNIVAMGFPSENLEGVYRNNLEDVVKFLDMKHKDKYRVYNLCSEKFYETSKFNDRVAFFGFDDHNAPPFKLMESCCRDMDLWLMSDTDNVAIVHCKAGKGRTGVMICAYLLYKGLYTSAADAMKHYAKARTENEKGVTIPSQRRYITYFGYYISNSLQYSTKTVLLNSITFVGTPTFTSGTCSPSFVIYQNGVSLHKSKTYEIRKSENEPTILQLEKTIPICGDVKIDFFHHKDRFRKERMFVFWFNTYFLEAGVTLNHPNGGGTTISGKSNSGGEEYRWYELTRYELDKANKDKRNKFFPIGFKIRLNFAVPLSKATSNTDGPCTRNFNRTKNDNAKPTTRTESVSSVSVVSSNLKDSQLSPSDQTPRNASAPSSPVTIKRPQGMIFMSTSTNDISSNLSKSEEDLSKEPLSDDDDDDDDV